MKKILIMTCALCILAGASYANEPTAKQDFTKNGQITRKMPDAEQMHKIRKAHEEAFEQKLGLTEVQKLKARELRKAGHESIKPVMDNLRAKKQEAEKIRQSKLTIEEQEQQLTAIDKDIADLQKQAQTIRKQNMKDFESILTRDQKKILKNMKKQGRKDFEQSRKQLPPPPCKPIPKK